MKKTRANRQASIPALHLSALAIAMAISHQTYAQDIEEVQITGSRIQRAGMESPTPVTDVSLQELADMDPGQIAESLTQLPQFFNSQRPSQVGWNSGGANLNLRGAGAQRSLVLLDGRRVPAGNRWGIPNISALPEGALRNVQTVTGGASAAYGTDAVAGVVNFMLDTDFVGVKAKAQYGVSSRGDGDNDEIGLTWGADIGADGHIIVSADMFTQDPIRGQSALEDRRWYKQMAHITNPDAANGGPRLITRPYATSTANSTGGTISANGSALNRWVFTRDSSGNVVAGPQSFSGVGQFIGGCNCQALTPATQNWGSDADNQISNQNERENLFVFYDHDVTENLNVYGQVILGETTVESPWFSTPFLSGPWTINLFSGNPYLPANVQQIMDDEGRASINMALIGDNRDGINPLGAYMLEQVDKSRSWTAGFSLDLANAGFFTDWTLAGYYQVGKVNQQQHFFNGPDLARLPIAVDAVRDNNGNIVCRAALVNPVDFGDCVPVNILGGVQSISSAAADYIRDDLKIIDSDYEQTFAEITFSGQMHEGFGAGPILGFVGASHREDDVFQYVPNLEDEFVYLRGQNTGFRGLVPENLPGGMLGVRAGSVPSGFIGTSNLSRILFTGSIQTPTTVLDGGFDVDEVFGEVNIPLISGASMAEQVDLSLAYRYADYSGSGGINSWKAGLSWDLNGELRLRATLSRDVRAATLRERYDETAGGAAVTDPFNGNSFIFTASRNSGNPFVDPEEADTLTFGAIWQPEFLPGFSTSIDWYDIKIDGALAQPPFQDIVDGCFEGAQQLCNLIERGSDNLITRITTIYFNLDEYRLKGIDLEMRYSMDVDFFGDEAETLTWRFVGTQLRENSQLVPGAPRDYLDRAQPEFRLLTNLTYTNGDFRAFLNGRFIDGYLLNRRYVEGVDVDDNTAASVFYTDLTLGYDFEVGNTNLNVFLTTNNLFDRAPPQTPGNIAFLGGTNGVSGLYDAIGRRYALGLNVSF